MVPISTASTTPIVATTRPDLTERRLETSGPVSGCNFMERPERKDASAIPSAINFILISPSSS
jgi:hypothetical protein